VDFRDVNVERKDASEITWEVRFEFVDRVKRETLQEASFKLEDCFLKLYLRKNSTKSSISNVETIGEVIFDGILELDQVIVTKTANVKNLFMLLVC
jgi:hypothetical protein